MDDKVDCDPGKLFVGGISFETTEDTLRDHFSKYGQVVETVIMKDRVSGVPRGFGFVLFSDPSLADSALLDNHVILSRTVEVKKALPRGGQHRKYQQQSRGGGGGGGGGYFNKKNYFNNHNQFRTKKIFVGGLSASVTEEQFKAYFDKFGKITDVVVMYDNVTHRARGFGFITFDTEEAVDNVMHQSFHVLNNKSVEVKRAVPKDGSGNGSASYNNNFNTNNSNDNGLVAQGGSVFPGYGGVFYPPFAPRYNAFGSYGPIPGYGYSYGAYPSVGYGGVGFGPMPMAAPRMPWNGPGMVGVRGGLMPFPPAYMNGAAVAGGFMGMVSGGGYGKYGSYGTQQPSTRASLTTLEGEKSDDESSVGMGGHEAVVGNQSQSLEGTDRQTEANTVGNTS